MKTIINRKIFILIAFVFCVFNFFSCDGQVALGDMINLSPPVVTFIKPDFMQNISGSLEIEGTAADNREVVFIYITIERVGPGTNQVWKQEWQGERGVWKSKRDNSEWENENGIWNNANGLGDVKWSINVPMGNAPDGEYVISVNAENNVWNKGPVEQRRVIIDNVPPVVKVLMPSLYEYSEVSKFNALKNPALLDKLHNQNIKIKYEISDDFSVDSIVVMLTDLTGDVIYYNEDQEKVKTGWSGEIIIDGENIKSAGAGEYPLYLQVVTMAYDKAAQSDPDISCHGLLAWWPDSDKPWTIGGGIEDPTKANEYQVYPESEIQIMSYDDDGVQCVKYQLFDKNTGEKIPGYEQEKIALNNPPIAGRTPSTFFSFGFTAPQKWGEYRIDIWCEDINNLQGDFTQRYFYVLETSAPTITVTSPLADQTLFGNENGDFTISGTAGDATDPVELKIAWINPNAGIQYQFEYLAVNYSGWNTASGGSDSAGNKVWNLTLSSNLTPNEETQQMTRTFNQTFNLFSGAGGYYLGISENIPLGAQTFILKVTGNSGREVTLIHSARGDISPPNVNISRIEVRRGASVTSYTPSQLDNSSMNALSNGDQIYMFGTWSDDSFENWKNAARMGGLSVTWNGDVLSNPSLSGTSPNGTWQAGPYTISSDEEASRGGGRIEVSLKDLAGNMGMAIYNARVDTNIPVLMFISSNVQDGSYSAGKTIEIYLEFNKAVTYTGAAPSLSLNNAKTAAWNSSSNSANPENDPSKGSAKHTFSYTVSAGDDTALLNVTNINYTGNWTGSGGSANLEKPPTSRNLADTQKIKIDTVKPAITGARSLSGLADRTNYYRADQTIYIVLSFNEEIDFTQGNGTLLNLNSGGAALLQSQMGQDSLLFTYAAAANQNANPLRVNSFVIGSSTIKDLAGNSLDVFSIPENINEGANARTIVIDTQPPSAPVFSSSALHNNTYDFVQTFTLTATELDAAIEYKIGSASPWIQYSGEVELESAGTYNIYARQTDRAGNTTPQAGWFGPHTITIEASTPLLQSFGGSKPGTYGKDKIIDITLKLRDAVNVTGNPTLTLNVNKTPAAAATANFIASSSGTNSLLFQYTIQTGDSVELLKINSINIAAGTDKLIRVSDSLDVTEQLTHLNKEGKTQSGSLDFYTQIKIDTIEPSFIGPPVLSQNKLILNFTKEILKGNGTIKIEQSAATFIPPAVLSKNDYGRFGGDSRLKQYYTLGTNGTDNTGKADLTEKYILNFNLDPAVRASAGAEVQALIDALVLGYANLAEVPVVSQAVKIGADGKSMEIDLSSAFGYILRVKGVTYNVSAPDTFAQDDLGRHLSNTITGTITNPGVNDPVIRVQRKQTEADRFTVNNATFPEGERISWVSADAETSVTLPSGDGKTWIQIPSYWMHPPYAVTFTSGDGYVPITLPAWNTFVKILDVSNTTQPEAGWISLSAVGNHYFWKEGDLWHASRNNQPNPAPSGMITINHAQQFWLKPDVDSIIIGNNPNDSLYLDLCEEVTAYVKVGSGIWRNAEYFGNTRGVNVPSFYAVKTGDNDPNWTTDDKSGLPGWIRYHETLPARTVKTAFANQPATAKVKISCQTPNVNIYYSHTENNLAREGNITGPYSGTAAPHKENRMPAASATPYTAAFDVGDSVNITDGFVYGIRAAVRQNSAAEQTSDPKAYEVAARSVLRYTNFYRGTGGTGNVGTLADIAVGYDEALQLWLRGGDVESGNNLTPGFPLAWDEKNTEGARLLTSTGGAAPVWYWMTWEVTSQAYFHFIAGTTITVPVSGANATLTNDVVKGPKRWSWGKNRWAFQYKQFILYPGASLSFYNETTVAGQATVNFEFYNNFGPPRD